MVKETKKPHKTKLALRGNLNDLLKAALEPTKKKVDSKKAKK
jgi:hypothetical protein